MPQHGGHVTAVDVQGQVRDRLGAVREPLAQAAR